MKNEFDIPSFYLHQLNALFIFIALFVFFMNYSVIKKSNPYQLVVLWLLFSLAFGIHGISHLGAEYVYGYNPIRIF
jgi:hypothetical protein